MLRSPFLPPSIKFLNEGLLLLSLSLSLSLCCLSLSTYLSFPLFLHPLLLPSLLLYPGTQNIPKSFDPPDSCLLFLQINTLCWGLPRANDWSALTKSLCWIWVSCCSSCASNRSNYNSPQWCQSWERSRAVISMATTPGTVLVVLRGYLVIHTQLGLSLSVTTPSYHLHVDTHCGS